MIRAPLRLWHKKSERRASQLSRSLSAIGRGSLNCRTLRTPVFFENSVLKPLRTPDFFKRHVLDALRAEHPLRQLAEEGQLPHQDSRLRWSGRQEGRLSPGRTDPSASRPAQPPRRAPRRTDPPVVCPGLGFDRCSCFRRDVKDVCLRWADIGSNRSVVERIVIGVAESMLRSGTVRKG